MKLNELLLSVAVLLLSITFGLSSAHAQTGRITGVVTDSTTGDVLPGVNVVIAGTQQGASTNAHGVFTIADVTPGTYDLRASFVGYNDRVIRDVSVAAGEATEIDIQLAPSAVQLEEVVAVGYGVQREEDVTSAVSSVDETDFVGAAPKDAAALIEGQVAGLNIRQTSGNPTEGSEISLRGTTTMMADNDPLILIDGVPGNLNTVAPQQIKSVDVLKGGSAAAIYGTRASNGVILITTTEQQGETTRRVQYSGSMSYERIKKRPDFLTASEFREFTDIKDYGYNTDWLERITRDPISQVHTISVSGGGQNTSYSASVNYENRRGLFIRSDNESSVGRLNISQSLYDRTLTLDANATARFRNYYSGTDFQYEYIQAMLRNPTDRVYNDQGLPLERTGFLRYQNPVGLIEESNGRQQFREIRVNGTATLRPLEGLSVELMMATTRTLGLNGYQETFAHRSTRISGINGYASRSASQTKEDLIELTGTHNFELGNHDVNVLAGYSHQYVEDEGFNAANQNFPTDVFRWSSLESGQGINQGRAEVGSDRSAWELGSYFGRVNYDWQNRYIFMASVRYEASSKFGANHRWGAFPAVSAGWRISEEGFMEGVSFVDQLKLRAGYGVTGIAPSNRYLHLTAYQYGGSFYNNGSWAPGLTPARNPNPDLKWEEKAEVDIGVDFSLFNDRLTGSVGVYRQTTSDMLWEYDVPVPPNLYSSTIANVGKIRNQGIEGNINYTILSGSDLSWDVSANYSTNQNKLLTLSNQLYERERDWFTTGYTGAPIQLSTHRVDIGNSLGNFYGFKAVDITENGEWIVLDSEGNHTHIDNVSPEDRRILGNGIPNHNIAINTSIQYNNFDVRLNMRGAFAFQILNFQRMFYENPTRGQKNRLMSAYDEVYGKAVLNYPLAYTSYYIEDGDYWKIENLTIGYNLSGVVPGVSNARVYVSGRNLWTITGYKGIDPEVSATGLAPGNDPRYKYPTTRRYTVGVNITLN